MKATLRALYRGDSAQDLVEYSLLGALLSVVSLIALQNLGGIMRSEFYMIMFQIKH
jgi:Flp pilus assembly pilin Flp